MVNVSVFGRFGRMRSAPHRAHFPRSRARSPFLAHSGTVSRLIHFCGSLRFGPAPSKPIRIDYVRDIGAQLAVVKHAIRIVRGVGPLKIADVLAEPPLYFVPVVLEDC